MKKLLLLFVCCINLTHTNPYRRLCFIADFDIAKINDDQSWGAMLQSLTAAMIYQSSPILMHGQALLDFINRKYFPQKYQSSPYAPQLSQTTLPKNINEFIKQNKQVNIDRSLILQQMPFNSDQWQLFDCPNTPLVLLVPNSYMQSIMQSQNSPSLKKIEHLGFYDTALAKINLANARATAMEVSTHIGSLKKLLDYKKSCSISVKDVSTIFARRRFNSEPFSWNIYLAGHGSYDGTVVAGMPLKTFQEMLNFFNTQVSSNFLYYETCFGGTDHLEEVCKPFQKTNKLRFTLASAGTTSSSPTGGRWGLTPCVINNILTNRPSQNFAEFFKQLETKKSTVNTAISYLLLNPEDAFNNVPLIRYPHAQTIHPFNNPEVTVLNKATILKHLIDKKGLHIKDKTACLFFSSLIPLHVNLANRNDGHFTEIYLMNPDEHQYIERLEVPNFYELAQNLMRGKTYNAKPQYLYVSTLQCNEPINLEINNKKQTIDKISRLVIKLKPLGYADEPTNISLFTKYISLYCHHEGKWLRNGTIACWPIKMSDTNQADANMLDNFEKHFTDFEQTTERIKLLHQTYYDQRAYTHENTHLTH